MIGLVRGDARMIPLGDETVQCVVTSPPYWGLRDYGIEPMVWGGSERCEHGWLSETRPGMSGGTASPKVQTKGMDNFQAFASVEHAVCHLCGAWRGSLGLEPTPELYVEHLVEVFREVRRVLRKDGTCWLNLGDSYNSIAGNYRGVTQGIKGEAGSTLSGGMRNLANKSYRYDERRTNIDGLKPKDLVGIPWRVAFALQADGWWLRSDIIWSKPNPMPESVLDRPTRAHEYLFLLSKGQWRSRIIELPDFPCETFHLSQYGRLSPANTWCGTFCVGLASSILDYAEGQHDLSLTDLDSEKREDSPNRADSIEVSRRPVVHRAAELASRFLSADTSTKEFLGEIHGLLITLPYAHDLLKRWVPSVISDAPGVYRDGNGAIAVNHSGQICKVDLLHGRAIISDPSRCVYYYDAEAIAEQSLYPDDNRKARQDQGAYDSQSSENGRVRAVINPLNARTYPTRNRRSVWTIATQPFPEAHFATFPEKIVEPCILAGSRPGDLVLDPFCGSGTVGRVCVRLNRRFVGLDLKHEYLEMARRRTSGVQRELLGDQDQSSSLPKARC